MKIEDIRKLVEPLGFEFEKDFVFTSPLSCTHNFKGCKNSHDVLMSIYDTGLYHGYNEGYEQCLDGDQHKYHPKSEGAQESTISTHRIDKIIMAEQQLLGFGYANMGYRIKTLVESMGLTLAEWEVIKSTYPTYLSETAIQEVDEYLSTEAQAST